MPALRYLAGEEESMIEVDAVTVAHEVPIVDDDDDDDYELPEVILEIDESLIDDCSDVIAKVICSRVIGYDEMSEELQRFLYEEIAEGITQGLETCDFSRDNFELWTALDTERTEADRPELSILG